MGNPYLICKIQPVEVRTKFTWASTFYLVSTKRNQFWLKSAQPTQSKHIGTTWPLMILALLVNWSRWATSRRTNAIQYSQRVRWITRYRPRCMWARKPLRYPTDAVIEEYLQKRRKSSPALHCEPLGFGQERRILLQRILTSATANRKTKIGACPLGSRHKGCGHGISEHDDFPSIILQIWAKCSY